SPRAEHVAIYDPTADRMIVHGGNDTPSYPPKDDAWALSLANPPQWQVLSNHPPGSPVASAYDSRRNRLLVSIDDYPNTNATWALQMGSNNPRWSMIPTSGEGPSRRQDQATIYDPVRDRVIFFGGDLTNEVW